MWINMYVYLYQHDTKYYDKHDSADVDKVSAFQEFICMWEGTNARNWKALCLLENCHAASKQS